MTEAEYGTTAWCMQCNLRVLQGAMDRYVQASTKEERKKFAGIIVNHALGLIDDAIDLEWEES